MKKTLLVLAFLLSASCVADPVDTSLSYLQADADSYKVVGPSMEAMILHEYAEPLEDRAVNPWTGMFFTDEELGSLQLVLDSWHLRLQGAGVEVSDE